MSAKKRSSAKASTAKETSTKEKGETAEPGQLPKESIEALGAAQTRETLAVMFFIRFVNAFCVRTFFQPDEYYQALEPAWRMVFGENSGAWLTWEWQHGLRSSLHPAIFSIGYFLVDSFWGPMAAKAKAQWLTWTPSIMQAGFAALSDWYTWRLAEKLYGASTPTAWSVLVMMLMNPWQWYTSTRTFSNCVETTLTAMALYYWPWELLGVEPDEKENAENSSPGKLFTTWGQANSLRYSLILAALAILLRPTNALIWLAIGSLVISRANLDGRSPLTRSVLLTVIRQTFFCGSMALGISLIADRQYYGDLTFPPFEWLRFNVSQDIAVFYGENDWHYYLSQGLPLLCTTISPFVLVAFYQSTGESPPNQPVATSNARRALTFTVLTTIAALSYVSHKEVRFITPLLPALHILAAPHVTSFFTTAAETATTCPPPALGWKKTPLLVAGVLVNVVIGGYLSWLHAAAPIQVMTYLRTEFENIHPDHLNLRRPANATDEDLPQDLFALFLTPCHATPWRSHLVYPTLRARALTCEPPIDTAPGSAERASYEDETSRFYADPVEFLRRDLWPRDAPGEDMARYIVGFEGIGGALHEYFDPSSGPGARHRVELREAWSAWNGLFTDDERKTGRLVVWSTGFYDDPIVT